MRSVFIKFLFVISCHEKLFERVLTWCMKKSFNNGSKTIVSQIMNVSTYLKNESYLVKSKNEEN